MSVARTIWPLLRKTVAEFSEDNVLRLAAALAFYTALSIAPLLLLVITIAGMLFGEEAARGQVVHQLQDLIGKDQAEAIEKMLASSQPKDGGLVAGLIGLVTLLFGATGVFAALQDSLNTVWDVEGKQSSSGFWRAVKDRVLSFSMVCGMAFLLLVSLVLNAAVQGLGGVIQRWWPGGAEVLGWSNAALSVLLTFAMFAMIFKVLPHVRLAWSDVWIGAAITTVLFEVGRHLIALYLGRAAPGSTFGAAGSFVALLLWLYYSAVILLFGAEFTQVYATREGTAAHGVQVEGAPRNPPTVAPAPAVGVAPG